MKRLLSFVCLCFLLTTGLSWQVGAYDEGVLYNIKYSGSSCKGCDLTNVNLTGRTLSDRDFSKTRFDNARLADVVLINANLSEAVLTGADLTGADLTGADLRNADLRSADLTGADLRNADLRSADLTGADLTGSDLENADLRGGVLGDNDLSKVNFRGANLSMSDFRGKDLHNVSLEGAVLRDADFRKANLSGTNLRSTDLTGANLSGAIFLGTWLYGAKLASTTFDPMDLTHSGSRLIRIDIATVLTNDYLNGKELARGEKERSEKQRLAEEKAAEAKRLAEEKAAEENRLVAEKRVKNRGNLLATMKCISCDLTNTDFSNLDLSGSVLTGANLSGANLKNTNLTKANLSNSNLSGAVLTGAILTGANTQGARNIPKDIRITLAKERLKDAYGYKDIKIGITSNELSDLGVCKNRTEQDLIFSVLKGDFSSISSVKCYDKRDWKFRLDFSGQKLRTISINIGVLSSDYYNEIYVLLRKNYQLDYGVTQRDVDLFNNGDKMFLYEVFEGGQVALGQKHGCAERNSNYENNCARMEVYLFVEYRDKENAALLVKATQPQKDKASDF